MHVEPVQNPYVFVVVWDFDHEGESVQSGTSDRNLVVSLLQKYQILQLSCEPKVYVFKDGTELACQNTKEFLESKW